MHSLSIRYRRFVILLLDFFFFIISVRQRRQCYVFKFSARNNESLFASVPTLPVVYGYGIRLTAHGGRISSCNRSRCNSYALQMGENLSNARSWETSLWTEVRSGILSRLYVLGETAQVYYWWCKHRRRRFLDNSRAPILGKKKFVIRINRNIWAVI
jgi:hypothetical protein